MKCKVCDKDLNVEIPQVFDNNILWYKIEACCPECIPTLQGQGIGVNVFPEAGFILSEKYKRDEKSGYTPHHWWSGHGGDTYHEGYITPDGGKLETTGQKGQPLIDKLVGLGILVPVA